ncbi:MAG: GDP-mannose 4,6-dehydratase [Patescibacteria group bacterium]|jgi:GDP-4-dehydro-6-deoxy-D-mannose reductase
MKKKIVVTGSDGFVGKYLVELLGRSQDKIYRLDRPQADITKFSQVKIYLKKIKPDQVYHLAGFASGAGKDKNLIFEVNVEGTLNILRALKEIGKPCKVLLASTAYVYGNTSTCAKENAATSPGSFYDQSKLKMEVEAKKYHGDNLEIVITRATNHTGPGQKPGFAVPDFCFEIAATKDNGEIAVGNLETKRDLFDVRDCVRAYKMVMQKGKTGEFYNIGPGHPVSMKSVLKKIIAISKKKIKTAPDLKRIRLSDITKNCVNSTKIKKLGWQPKISLEKTLKDTYRSFLI